jgi:hypothetical protein
MSLYGFNSLKDIIFAYVVLTLLLTITRIKMKNFNAFFTIGIVGMIVTAVLHILFALVLNLSSVHSIFFTLYPTFTAFLAIGAGQIIKRNPSPTPN